MYEHGAGVGGREATEQLSRMKQVSRGHNQDHITIPIMTPVPVACGPCNRGTHVLPSWLPCDSMRRTSPIPFSTSPKTTCFPSRCGVTVVVMKNWDPLVPVRNAAGRTTGVRGSVSM